MLEHSRENLLDIEHLTYYDRYEMIDEIGMEFSNE